ncbi:uncharacterized protein B0I36DRAFT_431601 [Microdochium trichocladiopsis]|uniref:Uncharacterized protein n=1 Tax=Microdochium trichocladiopsis TaxID=1682393 RepID=A0A9P8Y899_9PEZI|nr:uncharacterized protein B0I36DRAFT_431601 [Microdochium trichocladiopsis]KAH7031508.1 hypothetical protein B0I36DRAFT_431601 [Microdochium trichocladiopsis]
MHGSTRRASVKQHFSAVVHDSRDEKHNTKSSKNNFEQPNITVSGKAENSYGFLTMELVPGQACAEQLFPGARPEPDLSPPSLNYTLRDKKLRIAVFWCFVFFDCALVPVGLYLFLWYNNGPGSEERDPLSANLVLSIVTATIGGTGIIEFAIGMWKLWKKGSNCRVIGAKSRWYFDWFHWWFGLCLLIVVAELVVGTAFTKPNRRLLAMPLSSVLAVFGALLLVTDVLHLFSVRTLVRISSVPRGDRVPVGIYPIIEDVCAVSGSGTTLFRESLERRYKASPIFRIMLRRLSVFWTLGALGCSAGTSFMIWHFDDIDLAFGCGWMVPFIWAGVWCLATIVYVQHMLAKEKRLWAEVMALNVRAEQSDQV